MIDAIEAAAKAVNAEDYRRDRMSLDDLEKEEPWRVAIARAAILAFLKACESDEACVKIQSELTWLDYDQRQGSARAVLRALADLAGGGT